MREGFALRKLFIDIQPLRRSPAFRRLWIWGSVSSIGSQMGVFAISLQVFRLTHSAVAVGATGLFVAVPTICIPLIGGSAADVLDRRRLLIVTGLLLTAVSVLFAAQSLDSWRSVWIIYVLTTAQATLGAVAAPTRRAITPNLLAREDIPAAMNLNNFTMYIAQVSGPLIAGVLVSMTSLSECYLVDAASFLLASYGAYRLPPQPPAEPDRSATTVGAVKEALAFITRTPVLRGAFLADLSITLLGVPTAIMPSINARFFGGSARTLGELMAALAIGGLAGTVVSGHVQRSRHPGRTMLVAGASFGAITVAFGLSRSLPLSLALLAGMGAADVTSLTACNIIVQLVTPDHFRGRISAAEMVVGMGGPQLGGFRAGAISSLSSPATSIIIGGASSIIGASLIFARLPRLVRYNTNVLAKSPASASQPEALPVTEV